MRLLEIFCRKYLLLLLATTRYYQTLDLASLFNITNEYFKKLIVTTGATNFCRKVEEIFDNLNRSGSLTLRKSHNIIQNLIDVMSVAPQACQGVSLKKLLGSLLNQVIVRDLLMEN